MRPRPALVGLLLAVGCGNARVSERAPFRRLTRAERAAARAGAALDARIGGDLEAAERLLRQAIALAPRSADLHARLSLVLFTRGKRELAAAEFERVLEMSEFLALTRSRRDAYVPLANYLIAWYDKQGRQADVARVARRMAARHPEDPRYPLVEMRALLALGRFDDAREPRARAERLDSTGLETDRLFAQYARTAKRFDLALRSADRYLDRARALGFDAGFMRVWRARLLAEAGRPDEAAKAYAKIIGEEKVPHRRVQLAISLAEMWANEKNTARTRAAAGDAARRVETAGLLPGEVALLRQRLAMALFAVRAYDACEAELRAALEARPGNANAQNSLAYVLAVQGRSLEEAERLAKSALEKAPNEPAFLDTLGWVYYRRGNLDRARELISRAADAEPHAEVLEHLGDVERALGNREAARESWKKALELEPERESSRKKLESEQRKR